MEGIAEAVTFGAPDAVYGQAVEVAIVLKSTHINTLTEKSITDYCTSKMAAFKVPRKVHIVEQIPKSATGKVQRRNVSDFFHKQSRAKL